MLSVIQLVTHATVSVDDVVIGSIQKGIMALVGIEKTDTEKETDKLFNKIINYELYTDSKLSFIESTLRKNGYLKSIAR